MAWEDMFNLDFLSEVPEWLKEDEESLLNSLEDLLPPTDEVSFRNKIVFLDPEEIDRICSHIYGECYEREKAIGMVELLDLLLDMLSGEELDLEKIEELLSSSPRPTKCPKKYRFFLGTGCYSSKGWPEEGIYGPTIFLCPERIEGRAREMYGDSYEERAFDLLCSVLQHEMVHSYVDSHLTSCSPARVLGTFYRKFLEESFASSFELKYYEEMVNEVEGRRLFSYIMRNAPLECLGCAYFNLVPESLLGDLLASFSTGMSPWPSWSLPLILPLLDPFYRSHIEDAWEIWRDIYYWIRRISSSKVSSFLRNLERMSNRAVRRVLWTLLALVAAKYAPKKF